MIPIAMLWTGYTHLDKNPKTAQLHSIAVMHESDYANRSSLWQSFPLEERDRNWYKNSVGINTTNDIFVNVLIGTFYTTTLFMLPQSMYHSININWLEQREYKH